MKGESAPNLFHSNPGNISGSALYRHDTLDRSTDAFRLIRVLPERTKDGLIQLSLWHDCISTATYDCLSYRWGDNTRQCAVVINGEGFHIGENLHDFLQEAHDQSSGMLSNTALWVDSLCINQSSVAERSQQVQRMGHIYSKAQRVLIWLGRRHVQAPALCDWICSDPQNDCPEDLCDAWNQIRLDQYWYRAWIVQEVLLARCVLVVLPGTTVDYRLLGRAITRSTDLSRLDEESAAQLWTFWDDHWSKPRDRAQAHSTVDWLRHERNRNRFWELIHLQKTSKCADKRDRVYSLLGIISGDHGFTVDYEEDAVDLFWRAGEHFNAWEAPELVDILRIALLNSTASRDGIRRIVGESMDPWELVDSLRTRPDLDIRIPVRRATPTTSLFCRMTRKVSCKARDCHRAPQLQCTRNDILLCTSARSSGPSEHGCIHGLATPLDKPPAERFRIKVEAHHGSRVVRADLPSTSLQVLDMGTNTWMGTHTWSSMNKALDSRDLDRTDRVRLLIPARYAIWIWFGVHPGELEQVYRSKHRDLPSAQHILPRGTRISRGSVEIL